MEDGAGLPNVPLLGIAMEDGAGLPNVPLLGIAMEDGPSDCVSSVARAANHSPSRGKGISMHVSLLPGRASRCTIRYDIKLK